MSDSYVELRSDTQTRPTAGMRQAIAAAEGGDDACHEDPTVNRLEQRMAELLGINVPAGIMAAVGGSFALAGLAGGLLLPNQTL